MRRGSMIANDIMREYMIKKAFERKKRANCKDKQCNECKYVRICENKEEKI